MSTPHPVSIEYVSATEVLRTTFSDDLVVEFPAAMLRGFCPCARCQGHGGGPPTWVEPASAAATRVENVTPVGNYALCIVWGDGHDSGIHSFDVLRRMDVDGFVRDEMTADTPLMLRSS